ncbi:MAG: hypothetical protein CVV05_00215 [Gammaproteobacteria bacterium HGW-Gammaproteobacteria-1]|jgi:hypothetical protein|nr:MAG: hypothetical protein CVV05_00215 [Gammaproteobacteria bacterium HGW-Gammaproteobacteria-1]
MVKAASPVRLQQDLMEAAVVAGEQLHRSATEQIEYWADLGRRVACVLDPLKLAEIAAGIAIVKVEPAISPPLDPDAVFAVLEHRRERGDLAPAVATGYPRYQATAAHPGYLEQVAADGTRTVGMFHNGVFIPRQP